MMKSWYHLKWINLSVKQYNTVQYNGFYRDCKCKSLGKTLENVCKRAHACFLFSADNIKGEKRTSAGCIEDAKEAVNWGKPLNHLADTGKGSGSLY